MAASYDSVAHLCDISEVAGASAAHRLSLAEWVKRVTSPASDFTFAGRVLLRSLLTVAALAIFMPVRLSFAEDGIEGLLRETRWGESSGELLHQFGDEATRLPRGLDFGDSYADIVLTRLTLGGVPMVVFFQMDKATHGLKRIQLERPRHAVNPPSFRAITAALHADYGKPDQTCIIPVLPSSGYQAAAEEQWTHDGAVISAIFRDTTLQAFEGCLFGPATGWCGLHGQLLVRIGPPDGGADPCSLAPHHAARTTRSFAIERRQ